MPGCYTDECLKRIHPNYVLCFQMFMRNAYRGTSELDHCHGLVPETYSMIRQAIGFLVTFPRNVSDAEV